MMKRAIFVLCTLLTLFSVASGRADELFSNQSVLPGQQQNHFVSVDEAFPFNSFQQASSLFIDWQIKPGYYLYQQRIKVSAGNVVLGQFTLPTGKAHHDEFFGDVNIYTAPLSLEIPLSHWQQGANVTVEYQGCAQAGFCYPPETRHIKINAFNNAASSASVPAKVSQPAPSPASDGQSANSLARKLAHNWWTPLLFLLLGAGLAFTPCVLPMYPILTSIVLGGGHISQRRALGLSLVYVQGMALTYTLLGLVVASAGLQFQAALQQPWVLIILSLLFIVLALSMFGAYTLQLPSALQTRLSQMSNRQTGGHLAGVFIMGAISGLVCSPCTTAPLSGALLYVAQSGDLFTGAITLYALALGMGIPLMLIAVFGNQLLPKAGMWMNQVKILFGFVLLAAPLLLLERVFSATWTLRLWMLLAIAFFAWIYHCRNLLPTASRKRSLITVIAILGLAGSIQPLVGSFYFSAKQETRPGLKFIPITNVSDLQQQLITARQAGKPVMLDFYADWCVACKEFDKYTFHDPNVVAKLSGFVILQADVTRNSPENTELLKHLHVLGLPTIDFWNAAGEAQQDARLSGFIAAEPFLNHLRQHHL